MYCVRFLVCLYICICECLLQNNTAEVPSSRATSDCASTCARVSAVLGTLAVWIPNQQKRKCSSCLLLWEFKNQKKNCVARVACFCSIFLTTFLFSFFFFYKFNRHLCHSAFWCTHNPAHMSRLLFHLHLLFSSLNSCVCVSKQVYAFPSSSIFIHTYRHIHMHVCFDYSVMTPYNLHAPIIKRLCVPVPSDVARHLWPHVQGSVLLSSSVSTFPMNAHIPCSYQKNEILCVPTPKICALLNYVFNLIYSINLNTCFRVMLHQDCSIHITRILVIKWMQNKYSWVHTYTNTINIPNKNHKIHITIENNDDKYQKKNWSQW